MGGGEGSAPTPYAPFDRDGDVLTLLPEARQNVYLIFLICREACSRNNDWKFKVSCRTLPKVNLPSVSSPSDVLKLPSRLRLALLTASCTSNVDGRRYYVQKAFCLFSDMKFAHITDGNPFGLRYRAADSEQRGTLETQDQQRDFQGLESAPRLPRDLVTAERHARVRVLVFDIPPQNPPGGPKPHHSQPGQIASVRTPHLSYLCQTQPNLAVAPCLKRDSCLHEDIRLFSGSLL